MTEQNTIVLFTAKDGEIRLDVHVQDDTVWLNRQQMAALFGRDVKTIGKHVANALKEELDGQVVVAKFATTTQHGAIAGMTQTHMTEFYNLDVVISVGYRVKSGRGVEFRRWANDVLRRYIIEGYALNEKRLKILQKTVDIQSRMLSGAIDVEQADILKAVKLYSRALELLDNYDHQRLEKPKGDSPVYRITYEECRKIVAKMKGAFDSTVFGVEREEGKVEGIIAAVYQTAFGQDVYPSIEEKAANLLYFMVKDHPYVDGCKRIAASLFLEFLTRNNALFSDGMKIVSDGELVAITLMIAESAPSEKEAMTTMVMNLLAM